jgi:probable F420-dependent oxidoreductase
VPAATRVLAALGPRMLELARDRTAGTVPLLITPDATAKARALLGEDATVVVLHYVVVETDPAAARQAGRGPLGFLSKVPGYAANFRRMGFSDDDVDQFSDRMVDELVAWGDPETIAARVGEHLAAGADQVALVVLPTDGQPTVPAEQWRQLAKACIPGHARA